MQRIAWKTGLILLLCLLWASLASRDGAAQTGREEALPRHPLQADIATPQASDIPTLLLQGDSYFEKTYFVSPPGSNALESYQTVLKIDPDNAHAWERLREMAEISRAWAESAYSQDYRDEAITFYQRYLQIAAVMLEVSDDPALESEVQAATTRLTELGGEPVLSPSGQTAPDAAPAAGATALPPVIATPADESMTDVIQDYYQRYQQGEDIWSELNQNPLFLPLLIAAIAILVGLLILTVYLTVIRPRLKRRPLKKALRLIESGSEAELREADELLAQALISGLDKQSIDEARFAQIYVKAQLKEYDRASGLIQEYMSKVQPDRAVLYLALWLFIRQKEFEKVSEIYEKHGELVRDFLDARMLFGIGYLNLGQQSWERHDIKSAIRCFNILKQLDVLTEYVPKQIDDHQIVLGINSLFDGKIEQARAFFEEVIGEGKKSQKVTFEAKLGLLICDWREQELPDVDARLGELIESMHNMLMSEEVKPLFRHTLLWHVVALLFQWYQLPQRGGLPPKEKEKAIERIEKVRQIEPTDPDANLLNGLILYYFESGKSESAVALLKETLDRGVNVPEVIDLIRREEKVQAHRREVLKQYLQLAKKYLSDTSVPLSLREDLKRYLHKFPRFQQLEKEVSMGNQEEDAMPSLQDIQNRGQLLFKRVNSIVQPRLADAAEEDAQKINTLLETLNSTALSLSETKTTLERTEQELMLQAGEFLFLEEEKLEPVEGGVAIPDAVAPKASKRKARKRE